MGSVIQFRHRGSFKHTEKLFRKAKQVSYDAILQRYGQLGVEALRSATPIDSGETAASWNYEIVRSPGSMSIFWDNSNVNNGVKIAVILQYGHGTGTGGYVVGRDYINPAIRPIFDKIANDAWKEVVS